MLDTDDILNLGSRRSTLSGDNKLNSLDNLGGDFNSFALPYSDNPALFCRTHFSMEKGADYDQEIKFRELSIISYFNSFRSRLWR